MRPTVAEVDTQRLRSNYAFLRSQVARAAGPGAITAAVIKADAYGHGLALCARALLAEGASWLGVTSVDEAIALRTSVATGTARVLVMSGFFPGEEGLVLRHSLTPQLWEPWHFSLLHAAARRAGMPPASVPVHLEIDTGMSRQGVAPGEMLAHLLSTSGLAERDSPLSMEGVLTHFSSPECPENQVLAAQLAHFAQALLQLRDAGVRPRLLHAGNSVNALDATGMARLAALAQGCGASLMVRPGLALYGCALAAHLDAPELKPVLRWRTQITSIREIHPQVAVGYNETWCATRPSRLALIPVGYADGLDRALSNRGVALLRGQRVPIIGRISMDQTTLDITGLPAGRLGDEVILLGSQGEETISAQEIASLTGTIPYEVFCRISARVPRIAIG